MKKITALLFACGLLCGMLGGCGHEHTWQAATCLTPQTCTQCGETTGQPLGHSWVEASCTAPKTCSVCKQTEGEALGHSYGQWSEPVQDETWQWVHSCSCTVCGQTRTEAAQPPQVREDLGSAGELKGTTLLINIYANDAVTHWDFDAWEDKQTLRLMEQRLDTGVQWLTQQVANYGVNTRFIYGEDYEDLNYTFDFGQELLVRFDTGGYQTQVEYIEQHIPTGQLKEKYQAQNVIYMFYFNTDVQNTVNSWSLTDQSGVEIEIINYFTLDDVDDTFYYVPAAAFAHEIMHCFGAYDLYYASAVIPQSYVDHCAETQTRDIMYLVELGDEIVQEFTQLDAYYVGLVDSCETVQIWGLGKSTHDQ